MSAALLIGAYLLGAIPFGLLIAKRVKGIDVREAGSGNIGATNVARSVGKKLGVVTLILDALKGATPVLVAQQLGQPIEIIAGAGLAAVLGHVFPVYLKFRGGKGVATGLGMFLALTPIPTLIGAGAFLVVFLIFRLVSPGSLIGALVMLGANFWMKSPNPVLIVAGLVVLLILVRHTGNIRRLLNRTEQSV